MSPTTKSTRRSISATLISTRDFTTIARRRPGRFPSSCSTAPSSGRLLDQSELSRLGGGLDLGMHVELAAQAPNVCANGRVADSQPARDVAAGNAAGDKTEDVTLPSGQALKLAGHGAALVE